MYQVTQYYGEGRHKQDFYFNKKENAENFFRRIIKMEILDLEKRGITPNRLGYNNWDEYIQVRLNKGELRDVVTIQRIKTED